VNQGAQRYLAERLAIARSAPRESKCSPGGNKCWRGSEEPWKHFGPPR
jgi:hypothetical protein